MSLSLRVARRAESDIADAGAHYANLGDGLEERLVNELEELFNRLVDQPRMYIEIEPDIRRAVLHHFPYLVFYTVTKFQVVVLAVIHAAQAPAEIRRRLGA